MKLGNLVYPPVKDKTNFAEIVPSMCRRKSGGFPPATPYFPRIIRERAAGVAEQIPFFKTTGLKALPPRRQSR